MDPRVLGPQHQAAAHPSGRMKRRSFTPRRQPRRFPGPSPPQFTASGPPQPLSGADPHPLAPSKPSARRRSSRLSVTSTALLRRKLLEESVEREVGHRADLIANDEAEISEVVRRRLFEDLGGIRTRRRVANKYAKWCFERTARLPREWLAVDTATTEAKAREFLRTRFEACYPFHPATLSVFQRKWRALPQFQQTRGALAMLAQSVSWAAREHFHKARTEPLITLGSAPLHVPEFRAVVLGQLGEPRLDAAIEADLGRATGTRARPGRRR